MLFHKVSQIGRCTFYACGERNAWCVILQSVKHGREDEAMISFAEI